MQHTCCERHHAQPGKGHQCVVEPVSDGCSNTGDQPRKDVLDGQARRHVWRVDWRMERQDQVRWGEERRGEGHKQGELEEMTTNASDDYKSVSEKTQNLLGVKANLCLHNSQYSFLLCFNHCSKLWTQKTPSESPGLTLLELYSPPLLSCALAYTCFPHQWHEMFLTWTTVWLLLLNYFPIIIMQKTSHTVVKVKRITETVGRTCKLEVEGCWTYHSWWINLMLPVQTQGWYSGLSWVPSERHTRQMSAVQKAQNQSVTQLDIASTPIQAAVFFSLVPSSTRSTRF